MGGMERGSTTVVVDTTVAALGMMATGVYALHMGELPVVVGLAAAATLALTTVPLVTRVSPSVHAVVGAAILALGLLLAWSADGAGRHAARVVHDVGWTDALLGVWLVYASGIATPAGLRASVFDDASRARWRSGDIAFGLTLARRIPALAQRPWVALVLELAWPEPRPRRVAELLALAAKGKPEELVVLRERLRDKTGDGVAELRWELARSACDVLEAAASASPGDRGGPVAARFIVAAAKVVRDDAEAERLFAALVLPAVAHRA